MNDPEYQRKYFKKRYAEDPEFRRHRQEVNNDYRRRRYASDPEWRARETARGARARRNKRLMRKYGITVDLYDAALASQHGACAVCHNKLGRIVRVDQSKTGRLLGLLCTQCFKHIEIQRHVLAHAQGFEAYFKEWNMTAHLSRLHSLLRLSGRLP